MDVHVLRERMIMNDTLKVKNNNCSPNHHFKSVVLVRNCYAISAKSLVGYFKRRPKCQLYQSHQALYVLNFEICYFVLSVGEKLTSEDAHFYSVNFNTFRFVIRDSLYTVNDIFPFLSSKINWVFSIVTEMK